MRSKNRLGEIDFLRGMAILFVMLHHSSAFRKLVPDIWHQSWAGVEIFFGISGFLVMKSICRLKAEFPNEFLTKFWKRRFFRIFPPTIISLFLFALIRIFFEPLEDVKHSTYFAIKGLLLLKFNIESISLGKQNFYGGLWSLVIEEQFYLFLPVFLMIIHFNRVILRYTLVFLLFYVMLYLRPRIPSENWMYDRFHTFLKLDTLSVGVLVATCTSFPLKFHPTVNQVAKGITLLLLFLLPGIYKVEPYNTYGHIYNLITVLVGIMIYLTVSKESGSHLRLNKAVEWIGKRTLSLYLVHPIVFYLQRNFILESEDLFENFMVLIGSFGIIFIFANYYHRFVEVPFSKLGLDAEKSSKIQYS